jgi:hypothetical protein
MYTVQPEHHSTQSQERAADQLGSIYVFGSHYGKKMEKWKE